VAIPDYQTIMLPLLKLLADGHVHALSTLADQIAQQFSLTLEDRNRLLPSGVSRTFDSRVGWAATYMSKAGLFERPRRSHLQITGRGKELLSQNPARVDNDVLSRYPEFLAFKQRSSPKLPPPLEQEAITEGSPRETIDQAYLQLQAALADDLLARIKALPPHFFEKLVIDLLVEMGYGGTIQDAAQVVGQSGDGGIDGVIKEDKLGLDTIYVQAKRWDNTVGRPVVQGFAGSLVGKQASKGVFITTATFSADARAYVEHLPVRIVLIDGPTLAGYMIEHNVGVSIAETYQIKRVDSDYFIEE
jgi:restriction system protein